MFQADGYGARRTFRKNFILPLARIERQNSLRAPAPFSLSHQEENGTGTSYLFAQYVEFTKFNDGVEKVFKCVCLQ